MSKTRSFAELAEPVKADPARRARVDARKRAMNWALDLADLRVKRGFTQREVASQLAVTQANVSRVEHSDDVYLSTLGNYVAALGGRLEVNAVFPDGTFPLAGEGSAPPANEGRARDREPRGSTPAG